ncbi:ISL3 family transposase [Streptomyces melanogenes]|uniref:ISL3 family transposase n=1 Tax=Streptomyces melanogenes TaxID=67326 RepID=UPI00167F160D|nr:ISL3 family transposase [Streptomyces melanogenes]GGP93834.1 ISL3 family transposase [Streptomyces melanogenes]
MGVESLADVLFSEIDVRMECVEEVEGRMVVFAVACGRPPRCPDCRSRGSRVHSSYERRIADLPLGGRLLAVQLRVRRFFCDHGYCQRRTFVEQVDRLSERYRRSSTELARWQRAVAVELGGRPAERLCRTLGLAAGRTRLLSLLTEPVAPARAPRVLGVDEFAFRRGRRYGTVLVDAERGEVVDVLPDRDSETFAAWLTAHPGAQIICRDRATAFSRAVRQAAPEAVEVADRWHLLHNLSAAVEKTCHQHRACLRKHAEDQQPPPVPVELAVLGDLPPQQPPATQMVERTRQRHAEIHRLLDARWTISAIARRLNLDRKTVRRFKTTDIDTLLVSSRDRRPVGVFAPFRAHATALFTASGGCITAPKALVQLRELGYQGHVLAVRKHFAALRSGTAEPVRADVPSPRKITSWIMRPHDRLADRDQERLLKVRLACPDIARACDLARTFHDLTTHRRGHLLMDWIREAEREAPAPLHSFAGYLRHDLDAVTAGLTLPWSSGSTEGHVCRVKAIKRAMFGRASFRLLRIRILTRS